MDVATKNAVATTPRKDPHGSRSKIHQEPPKYAENLNPNASSLCHHHTPRAKPFSSSSPTVNKSCSNSKYQKSASKKTNPIVMHSPQNKIRQRKFLVAKKNPTNKKNEEESAEVLKTVSSCSCKCGNNANNNKCLCVAYENLRKSQEAFFKNQHPQQQQQEKVGAENESVIQVEQQDDCSALNELCNVGDSMMVKRRRERVRENVPCGGSGKVMHLVKAFEKLLSEPTLKEEDVKDEKEPQENNKKVMKWALPGLQLPTKSETGDSGPSFCPPDLILTYENLGLDPRASVSSSWDSNRGSVSSRTSTEGRRSRRNSLESSSTFGGKRWKKKQRKVTSQKPFKLRTEQRGKLKEEEFVKKIQEMMTEEEKQRVPIAQGLPWTTDEPECLVKPPVKECTRPIDLKLHSDVRAMDRAEFDHQVAEKLSFIEQYKLERERQQKLAEEEEVRRLRKELIPKAQPMPYFDRPFIPRRSTKDPTIPRDLKFHAPHHKKMECSLSSWNDMSPYSSYLN